MKNYIFVFTLACFELLGCSDKPGRFVKGMDANDIFSDNKNIIQVATMAASGDTSNLKKILQKNININNPGKEGLTPLAWAFLANNKDTFELLLENGANVNINIFGEPFMDYIATPKVDITSEDFTFKNDDIAFLELALKYGGNPNAVNSNELSLLMTSCNPGSLKRTQLLISAGADLEYKDFRNDTALLRCASLGQYRKVLLLIENGANYKIHGFGNKDLVWMLENFSISQNNTIETDARAKLIQLLRKKGMRFSFDEEIPDVK